MSTVINYNNIYNQTFKTYGTNKIDFNWKYNRHVKSWLSKPGVNACLWASPTNKDCYRWQDFAGDIRELTTYVEFKLKPETKILIINSYEDVINLPKLRYSDLDNDEAQLFSCFVHKPGFYTDWNEVFEQYDAIYVDYQALRKNYWSKNSTEADQAAGEFADIYDVDTLMIRNLNCIETVFAPRTFCCLEIRTRNNVTKEFFDRTSEFLMSLNKKNQIIFTAIEYSRDVLITSTVLNVDELQDRQADEYYIVTKNTVIHVAANK